MSLRRPRFSDPPNRIRKPDGSRYEIFTAAPDEGRDAPSYAVRYDPNGDRLGVGTWDENGEWRELTPAERERFGLAAA